MDLNPRERNLEHYLRKQASIRGWRVVKFGYEGWPDDIVVAKRGVQGWIELKRRGEEPEELQVTRLEELQDRGCVAVWADSRKSVDAFLGRLQALVEAVK